MTLEAGQCVIFPTSVYHFGCSHMDFNEGTSAVDRYRRRLFMYMDESTTVTDSHGEVVAENEVACSLRNLIWCLGSDSGRLPARDSPGSAHFVISFQDFVEFKNPP